MSSRPVQIVNERPAQVTEDYLAFNAQDGSGKLRIWVSIATWEHLQAHAPPMSDDDDRRDHALGMIEYASAQSVPATSSDGQRILMID